MLSDPFWGHLLSGITKRLVPHGPVLSWGVENQQIPILLLCINPRLWIEITDIEEKKARLQHEMLHLLFSHPFSTSRFHYPHLYDLACDWVVQGFHPHTGSSFITFSPKELGIQESNTPTQVDFYYRALENFWLNQIPSATHHSILPKIEEYQVSTDRRSHESWHQSIAKLTKAERDIIMANIDQLIINTFDRVGTASISHWPQALRLLLEERRPNYRSSVDWRRILRLFVGRHKKTYLKNTLRRPSKRYGTTPGIRIQRQQKLLVALDTSASMRVSQIDSFFSEVHHLWKLGATIHIVECDTTIRRDYPYQGQRPNFVEGRGGSSFDPPIRWANEVYRPDVILYFTDGDAPKLQLKSRAPVIWLLSESKSDKWKQDQGINIELSLS